MSDSRPGFNVPTALQASNASQSSIIGTADEDDPFNFRPHFTRRDIGSSANANKLSVGGDFAAFDSKDPFGSTSNGMFSVYV